MPAPLACVTTFGVLLAAILAFAVWAEPVSLGPKGPFVRTLPGWLIGLGGPALLAATLLANLWLSPDAFRAHAAGKILSHAAIWPLPLLALLGFGATIPLIGRTLGLSFCRSRAVAGGERDPREALRDRLRTSSLATLLREDLDTLPSDASLTAYSSYFVGSAVERALAIPDWQAQLLRAMRCRPYDERWGAIEFVRQLPDATLAAHEAELAQGIEESLLATTDEIARRPAWLTEPCDRDPDSLGLIRSLLGAAKRFGGRATKTRLHDAIRSLVRESMSLKRDKAWRRLAKELEAAGFPMPQKEKVT